MTLPRVLATGLLLGLAWSAHAAPSTGDPVAGQLAAQACASCHLVGQSRSGGFGPPLDGVVGRRAGSVPGFAYSEAMKKSGIVWTEPQLTAFIHDPQKVVPGTRMRFYSWAYDDRKIADLLAYLRQCKASP